MRNSILRRIVFLFLCTIVFYEHALPWDDGLTHKDLSRYAAENSVLNRSKGDFLKNLGFEKGLYEPLVWGKTKNVIDWIREGAELEDNPTSRSFNHFHNPLKEWPEAGLDDIYFIPVAGKSSLLWAQDGIYQQSSVGEDWSWQKVKEFYYLALKSTTDSDRQVNFAKTFRGLGHQMHLVQDAAQPDHVRNDAHPEDAIFGKNQFGSFFFERWATKQVLFINSLASTPILPEVSLNISQNGLAPITQFLDTDQYNKDNPSQFFQTGLATSLSIGLAEYTNANFASNDTIFTEDRSINDRHYFPYPKKSSTDLQAYINQSKLPETVMGEDNIPDTGFWIIKERDGEQIEHFARPGYLTNYLRYEDGWGYLYERTFYRDEKCHEDYARLLIPHAVGYSAALLNYFFRDSIAITLPDTGVYAQTENRDEGFKKVTLSAQNTSPAGEEMTNGSIELVVKYRLALEDPFQSYPVPTTWDYSYIVVPELNGIRSIPSASPVRLEFDLSQNPIPINATDIYLQVVYKGILGQEEGAVAVGFKDISEPTPIDLFNDMDRICINGSWYVAGSPEAIALGNQFYFDPYPHNLQNIYTRFSSSTDPKYASSAEYNLRIPLLSAGQPYVRQAFILGDYQLSYSSKETAINADSRDPFLTWIEPYVIPYQGLKNQTEYTLLEDPEECALFNLSAPCGIYMRTYPTFHTFRDQDMWFEFVYENISYPVGSSCP